MKALKKQLQTEVNTAYLYQSIADKQKDDNIKKILLALSDIELGHAGKMLEMVRIEIPEYKMPPPDKRAKLQLWLGRFFGYDSIISSLANVERTIAKSTVKGKLKRGESPSGFEHNHLKIIEAISKSGMENISGSVLAKFEGRHKTIGGNAMRAAVLGANDGLVSNMSLVMGVAGAAAQNETILLTGLAGLLAGAISMALGEWLSVQSARELHLQQIELESQELEASPEDEKKELVLLYQAKGMNVESAEKLAEKVFANKKDALDALIIEELGIDIEELGGSAWEAAFVSFCLFAFGAIIPVVPYIFYEDLQALYLSVGASTLGLFLIGAAITLFTGKSIWFSGFRQVVFGLAAAAITYGIGSIIGVSIAG